MALMVRRDYEMRAPLQMRAPGAQLNWVLIAALAFCGLAWAAIFAAAS